MRLFTQPRKPVDRARDGVLPLFYSATAQSFRKQLSPSRSESISSNPVSDSFSTKAAHTGLGPAPQSLPPRQTDTYGAVGVAPCTQARKTRVRRHSEKALYLLRTASQTTEKNRRQDRNTESRALPDISAIESLDLSGRDLTRSLLEEILDAVQDCVDLHELDLSNNRLLGSCTDMLVHHMEQLGSVFWRLDRLSLSYTLKIDANGLRHLLMAIAERCIRLSVLKLDGLELDDACAEDLVTFLQRAAMLRTPLRELHLIDNELTARGCRKLLDACTRFAPRLKIVALRNPAPESLIARLACSPASCSVLLPHFAYYPASHPALLSTPIDSLLSEQSPVIARTDLYSDSVDSISQVDALLPMKPITETIDTSRAIRPLDAPMDDVSSYTDQNENLFNAELRKSMLCFIEQTFSGDSTVVLGSLADQSTTELCMLCINAIQLRTDAAQRNGTVQSIKELVDLKAMLEKGGLPPVASELSASSPTDEALSVAISLIQSLIKVITGQITLD